ncbi:unnamed protein product, partial [marine sediment metagenome]
YCREPLFNYALYAFSSSDKDTLGNHFGLAVHTCAYGLLAA